MLPTYMKIILGVFIGCLALDILSIVSVFSFSRGYFELAFALSLFSVAWESYWQYDGSGRRTFIITMIVVGLISAGAGLLNLGLTYGWIR